MAKSVKKWFEEIQDETFRDKCLSAMDFNEQDNKAHSLSDAIQGGIIWSDSAEGLDYWDNMCATIREIEQLQKTGI
jgi:hypothetical protein